MQPSPPWAPHRHIGGPWRRLSLAVTWRHLVHQRCLKGMRLQVMHKRIVADSDCTCAAAAARAVAPLQSMMAVRGHVEAATACRHAYVDVVDAYAAVWGA